MRTIIFERRIGDKKKHLYLEQNKIGISSLVSDDIIIQIDVVGNIKTETKRTVSMFMANERLKAK